MQTESIGCGLLAALCLTGGALAAGPDVTLLDIQSTSNYGAVGGIRGYAIGSHTCNIGTTNLIWANNGTPALAKGGSGDVLGGAIVGLRARGVKPYEPAVRGGNLHGAAGQLAADYWGNAGLLASELADWVSHVRRALV